MEPLTPVRVSRPGQVSMRHVPNLRIVPTPTTPRCPVGLSLRFSVPVKPRTELSPSSITSDVTTVARRLRPSPAGSPQRQAESSSLAFRTDPSPSDALHPASRQRSFGRLQDQTLTSWKGLPPSRFSTLAIARTGDPEPSPVAPENRPLTSSCVYRSPHQQCHPTISASRSDSKPNQSDEA